MCTGMLRCPTEELGYYLYSSSHLKEGRSWLICRSSCCFKRIQDHSAPMQTSLSAGLPISFLLTVLQVDATLLFLKATPLPSYNTHPIGPSVLPILPMVTNLKLIYSPTKFFIADVMEVKTSSQLRT